MKKIMKKTPSQSFMRLIPQKKKREKTGRAEQSISGHLLSHNITYIFMGSKAAKMNPNGNGRSGVAKKLGDHLLTT